MEEKEGLSALIDWLQVTFQNANLKDIIENVLQFDKNFMTYEEKGRFRYAGRYKFSDIELLIPPINYTEMGYHLYLTGSACREMEIYFTAQKRTWFDFLSTCLQCGGKFTRIDIAIDDRKTYFTVETLADKMKHQECLSKYKHWNFIDGGTIAGEKTGCTLNLGSRESNCSMVFYEKNYEQAKKNGKPVDYYGNWNRYELRLRKELATACIEEIVKKRNIQFIGMSIVNYYIRFVVADKEQSRKDRLKVWEPWEKFMEDMGKLKLSMEPAPRSLEQKRQWIKDYVAPTLKMLKQADDNLGDTFLEDTINKAELKQKHKEILWDYLQSMDDYKKQQK